MSGIKIDHRWIRDRQAPETPQLHPFRHYCIVTSFQGRGSRLTWTRYHILVWTELVQSRSGSIAYSQCFALGLYQPPQSTPSMGNWLMPIRHCTTITTYPPKAFHTGWSIYLGRNGLLNVPTFYVTNRQRISNASQPLITFIPDRIGIRWRRSPVKSISWLVNSIH